MMKQLDYDEIDSPIGKVLIAVDEGKLCALDFAGFEERMQALLEKRYGVGIFRQGMVKKPNPCGFSEMLLAYFSGELNALDRIPVSTGGTAFQQACWRALREIPPGITATYGEQAARLANPKAVRAVGRTNGLNPVALVLPCHRVVGANGTLTGYAGGLWRKEWLLKHEGALNAPITAPVTTPIAMTAPRVSHQTRLPL